MSKRTFGSLADLAKILEEASDPNSVLREDRQVPKPVAVKKAGGERTTKPLDPKRKAWYDRRLKESVEKPAPRSAVAETEADVKVAPQPEVTRAVVSKVGGTLMQVLATAKNPKATEPGKRPEAWRRKPGDPIF